MKQSKKADNYSYFYEERQFEEMLVRERKRTERSCRPFILALINIQQMNGQKNEGMTVEKIVNSLFSITREVDIKGWYKRAQALGIIFTEINGTDKGSVYKKISSNLGGILSEEIFKTISISCHMFPDDHDRGQGGKEDVDARFYPDISGLKSSPREKGGKRGIKRCIDIIGSLICLLIFFPFFLIVPVLIKMTSRGKVIYRQERIGRFGKRFNFYKFRTMYEDCDNTIHKKYMDDFIFNSGSRGTKENKAGGKPVYKMKNDPRLTPVGNLLRKTSIDELPQFINVLKGDMSLVGPRPPISYEMRNYSMWHRRRILEAKPGITGIWQVEGRSLVTFDEMVRMDLEYIRKWSILLDIKILLKTPLAVLTFKGAF